MESTVIKSRLVVILVDDYINQIIVNREPQITIDGQKASIIKMDGCYIFTEIPKEGVLESVSNSYQKRTEYIKFEELISNVLILRLIPDKQYQSRERPTEMIGSAKPGQKIHVRFFNSMQPYRLLDVGKEREWIRIYHADDSFLEAKRFLIESEEERESFSILYQLSDINLKSNTYSIAERLQRQYNPHHSVIKREYGIDADENGEYYFRVPTQFADVETVEIEVDGKIEERTFQKGMQTKMEV